MKFRKFRKNVKAVSPVISVLLMIAVAVVASLVTYAWVMGYIGFQTGKTGQAIQIQSVNTATGIVYVQNVGNSPISFSQGCLYVNGAQVNVAAQGPLAIGATATFSAGTVNSGDVVKVTAIGGTFSQITVP